MTESKTVPTGSGRLKKFFSKTLQETRRKIKNKKISSVGPDMSLLTMDLTLEVLIVRSTARPGPDPSSFLCSERSVPVSGYLSPCLGIRQNKTLHKTVSDRDTKYLFKKQTTPINVETNVPSICGETSESITPTKNGRPFPTQHLTDPNPVVFSEEFPLK